MTAPDYRPNAVRAAYWLLTAAAVLLIVGGLLAAFMSFDALRQAAPPTVSDEAVRSYARLYRGGGVLFAVAGLALAWFAGRARDRDPRARRAAITLGLIVVVLVALAAVFSGTHILSLLSLLAIILATLLLSRPGVIEWYAGE